MKKGIYIGRNRRLKHKTALIQERAGKYYAQFDDPKLKQGWQEFDKTDFILMEEENGKAK